MIKAGIIGSTGYAGQELVRLLLSHPEVQLSFISSRSYPGESFSSVFGNFYKNTEMKCIDSPDELESLELDVLFTALPHGLTSGMITAKILEKYKVIDLGADFRLKDYKIYEHWYNTKHESPELLKDAVYGLCELNRDKIRNASVIANPGCYTTCSILAAAPLLKHGLIRTSSLVIDAKSGVSGAGRTLALSVHYTECNESIKAYKIGSHRHTPEIEEQLGYICGEKITLNFTPHLVPMNRGILSTVYADAVQAVSQSQLQKIYEDFYSDEFFVRILPAGTETETKWVKGSNFTDISIYKDDRTGRIIITSALDNLIKGAAGQAVQNMNIMFNIEERTGLGMIPAFPI